MALPSVTLPNVAIRLSSWVESYEAIPNTPGAYAKHATATLFVLADGSPTRTYPVDISEADYDAAADPVAFVDCAIHAALQTAFADLSDVLCPNAP